MGHQEKCKALRKKIFNGIQPDRNDNRKYEMQEYRWRNAVGYVIRRVTFRATGLRRQYQVLKKRYL